MFTWGEGGRESIDGRGRGETVGNADTVERKGMSSDIVFLSKGNGIVSITLLLSKVIHQLEGSQYKKCFHTSKTLFLAHATFDQNLPYSMFQANVLKIFFKWAERISLYYKLCKNLKGVWMCSFVGAYDCQTPLVKELKNIDYMKHKMEHWIIAQIKNHTLARCQNSKVTMYLL